MQISNRSAKRPTPHNTLHKNIIFGGQTYKLETRHPSRQKKL